MFRNKRTKEDEKTIGETYREYIETFQNNSPIVRKKFIKGGTINGENNDNGEQQHTKFYNPKPILKEFRNTQQLKENISPNIKSSKKAATNKLSNLKQIGDEFKKIQSERKLKENRIVPFTLSNYTNDYDNSTNLFISNLQFNINENRLIEIFGKYGPLGSVKIMKPCDRKSASQSTNCGFVAFMSRVDAERALNCLNKCFNMKLSWGKSIILPSFPIYIPPALKKLYAPPPSSDLPFNAQKVNGQEDTIVKVTIPLNRNQLVLIHRMIEFVIQEGPEFELLIINKEKKNKYYKFLWDKNSPEHIYYRWKLYSMLHGDSKDSWSMKPFRMYKDSSIWIPPVKPDFTKGMPKELIDDNALPELKVKQFVDIIRNLNMSRPSITVAMVHCIDSHQYINEYMAILTDSFKDPNTNPLKKIARFFLFSDIIYNCQTNNILIDNIEMITQTIIKELRVTYLNLKQNDRIQFKNKILNTFKGWTIRKYFSNKLIEKLERLFLNGV